MKQADAQQILKELFENAVYRGQIGQHILLWGESDLLRKTLSMATQQVEGVSLRSISAFKIVTAGDMAAVLTHLHSRRNFLLIYDFDRLSKPAIEILAPAMDSFVLCLEVGQGQNKKTVNLELPPFALIGATTKLYLVADTLRQYFKQEISIEDDPDSPLTAEVVLH